MSDRTPRDRTPQDRTALGRVLDDLGPTLLEVVAGQADRAAPVRAIVIHDPLDPPVVAAGALVLGVGVAGPDSIAALLRDAGSSGAVGLVVREPVEVDDEVQAAVAASGVVLFGLARGASWAQVATLLRSLLAVDDLGHADREMLGGAGAGDLFAMANAVAALLDAPVTIEDMSHRVLAFSGRQDEADESRKETILGRQVPDRYVRELQAEGVFRALYEADRPVFVPPIPGAELARVAVRVRAGDELLGSVWAAVDGPLSPQREEAFVDSARLVALHLLRDRAGADVERRLRAELVATLLEGGPPAGAAADRLGLASGPRCVLALGLRDGGEVSSAEAALQRVGGAFALHLAAVHSRAAVALVGGVVYGVLPLVSADDDRTARGVAGQFLDRLGDRSAGVIVGVGRTVTDTTELPRSRGDADRVLRVLRAGRRATSVARADEVQLAAVLLELSDLVAAESQRPTGPVARLDEHDRRHGSQLLATLRAWLDAFGDVSTAAAKLHIHPNTFRYRLRRLSQVGELDLDDPDARFDAMLQLRLFDPDAGR